jgi:3-isopropylmalate dehydratase small subunit
LISISGRVWTFGNDINTDVIHPPEFFSLDPEVVRRGLFHGFDPTLQEKLVPGDVLVAGRNFGCGSSRETSIQSMKLNGIGAIIAIDFARIFFRSATNNALPCVTFADPVDSRLVSSGELVDLDFEQSLLRTSSGTEIPLTRPGSFVRSIWEAGGLLELLKLDGAL